MKTSAIRIHKYGGPDVMHWEEIDLPGPAAGEARIRHTAIGLNFVDVYHRIGLYPTSLPCGLGSEAAGVVEAVAPGVTEVAVGDRVVYTGRPNDAYAERRNFKAAELVPIPDGVSDAVAAATLLKGLTAWYLLHHSYRVQPGDPILLYAAAGGVGSIASQWARQLGATVIGIVSTAEKSRLAMAQGCHHIVMADDPDIAASVKRLTNGQGVAAVYDSVGRDSFMTSLDCLRPHGTLVSFGNSSGAVEPFAPSLLAARGSLYVTRPTLAHFVDTREKLLGAAKALYDVIESGAVTIRIGQQYALQDVAQAHRDLEARKTTGSTILIP
ncbi:MAG: quinone oxidoreductase [Gammaproteobacteria bacterium]|nr:quinone oxidoreductase [Gammaproteobacteria bacterium]MDH5305333.1 quinone oxidoreductase [Gammaproteobacteria bacterium]MDH5322519.1 quinone oxidoreductase [Gammaproteobacteria bacterium]